MPRSFLTAALLTAMLLTVDVQAQTRVDFHLLPAISSGPLDPDWSPDGREIAFAMRGDIWRVARDGGTSTALTAGPWYHSEPAWSPDGQRIALTIDRDDGNLDIGIVDAEGGAVTVLTHDREVDFAPAWSHDGNSIYFASKRNGDLDILRLDLASERVETVVGGPGHAYQPAVSPDGRHLAYVATVAGKIGSGGIWVKRLPDGDPELVHFEESSYRMKPQWTPEGDAIVYISDAADSNDVALIPVSGGVRVRLTEDGDDEFDAAPSPDGSRVAFVSNHDGPTTLYTVAAGGGPRANWTAVQTDDRRSRTDVGTVRGRVLGSDGEPVPARLMLVASDDRSYTEDNGFHRMVPATRTHYQHVDGHFEIEVPAGLTEVTAMRGFEYLPVSVNVKVPAGGVADVELKLEPLVDARSRGWYSGDMHVHDLHEGRFGLTHEDFIGQLVADDVGVANTLVHMDGTKIMGRWEDLTGSVSPLSQQGTILRYSQEFRGYFGHIGLIGGRHFQMPHVSGVRSTAFAADTLALEHVDGVRSEGGIAGFVHPYNQSVDTPEETGARDLPVLAALGKGDFYDVISVASRELESASVYYRMLNSGIRIPATGGTDNFSDVWYDPSGGTARTYAYIEPGVELSFERWLDAVRNDRTFASSGPLLFLDVAAHRPGDEIAIDAGASTSVDVAVEVFSIMPLDSVEIVANGKVVHRWSVPKDRNTWRLRTTVDMPQGGWITARAIGPASRFGGDAFAFAQTSPVYLRVGGEMYTSAEDAAFLAATVEQVWKRAEVRDLWVSDEQKAAYKKGVEAARDVYRRVVLRDPDAAALNQQAPERFRVALDTSKGKIVIELHRDWSPRGVDRFYNLVRNAYYDDMRIHRIRDGEFVQFGIHGEPSISTVWRTQRISDDPVKQSNLRGSIRFRNGTRSRRSHDPGLYQPARQTGARRDGFRGHGSCRRRHGRSRRTVRGLRRDGRRRYSRRSPGSGVRGRQRLPGRTLPGSRPDLSCRHRFERRVSHASTRATFTVPEPGGPCRRADQRRYVYALRIAGA